jgi:hypothetical protein
MIIIISKFLRRVRLKGPQQFDMHQMGYWQVLIKPLIIYHYRNIMIVNGKILKIFLMLGIGKLYQKKLPWLI